MRASPGSSEGAQVSGPHFVLRAEFDEETTIATARALERTRDELVAAAWPAFPFPEMARTEIFALSSATAL